MVHDDKKICSRLRLEWYVHQYEMIMDLLRRFLDSECSMSGKQWSASPSRIHDTVLKERKKIQRRPFIHLQ